MSVSEELEIVEAKVNGPGAEAVAGAERASRALPLADYIALVRRTTTDKRTELMTDWPSGGGKARRAKPL